MKNILCFGDSNTWGYNPVTKERYPEGIRWTSKLQEWFQCEDIRIIEEGLCGRTTIFEDETRPGRRGIDSIPAIFEQNKSIDTVILMLGTNDCKTYNHSSPKEIAEGVERCLEEILQHVSAENILLISPIHLGEKVWMEKFDPEFNKKSVEISKGLKNEYRNVAEKKKVNFLAASDYVKPSKEDQEHLNEQGHNKLAHVIYHEIAKMNGIGNKAYKVS